MSLVSRLKNSRLILLILVLSFALYSTYLCLTIGQRGYDTDLVVLSRQFLAWKITLPILNLPVRDIANYYNNYYLYFGPLASLLLMPFVGIFGESVPQVSIGVGSMVVSFLATFLIVRKSRFDTIDSLWLSVFTVFSSVLFSSAVINGTAYQVEALGVPFVLLALWAFFSKKNPFFIGLFMGMATLTRFTLMLGVAFFFFEMLQKRFTLKQFILLLIPVVVCLAALGAYNQRRFHSPLETGYNYSITKNSAPIGVNLKYGKDIDIVHIPANLYSFLLMAPEPVKVDSYEGFVLKFPYLKLNPWGVAIWFTSPLFVLLIARFKRGTHTVSAGLTAFLLSLPVLVWYSIGYAQVGYRYSLDFLPFLLLMLLPCLSPRLSKVAIALIVLGVLFNCLYSLSIWGVYPHFGMM